MGGKTKQTSSVTIDPQVMSRATENYDSNKAFAQTPATPYAGELGASLDTGASQGTLNDLLGFNAPQVSTGQNVSQDQIQHYLDPYMGDVVDATKADMEYARQVGQNANKGAVAARSAFGNGRRGIYEAEIDGASQRNLGSILGNLRSTGFDKAVGYGQMDLARLLQAATANQGAAISSAGVRSGAATSLAQLLAQQADNTRANQGLNYAEFVRQQNDPIIKRGLLNSSVGSMPVPQTQTQTTSGGGLFGSGIKVGWDAQKGLSFGV